MPLDIGEIRLSFNQLLSEIDTMYKPKSKKFKTYQTLITEYEEEVEPLNNSEVATKGERKILVEKEIIDKKITEKYRRLLGD